MMRLDTILWRQSNLLPLIAYPSASHTLLPSLPDVCIHTNCWWWAFKAEQRGLGRNKMIWDIDGVLIKCLSCPNQNLSEIICNLYDKINDMLTLLIFHEHVNVPSGHVSYLLFSVEQKTKTNRCWKSKSQFVKGELNPKIDLSSFEHLGIVEQLYED